MKGVECVYCGHKAARSRKKTCDYMCDYCGQAFTQADITEKARQATLSAAEREREEAERREVEEAVHRERQRQNELFTFRLAVLNAAKQIRPSLKDTLIRSSVALVGAVLFGGMTGLGLGLSSVSQASTVGLVGGFVVAVLAALVAWEVFGVVAEPHRTMRKLRGYTEEKVHDPGHWDAFLAALSKFLRPEAVILLKKGYPEREVITSSSAILPIRSWNDAPYEHQMAAQKKVEETLPWCFGEELLESRMHPEDLMTAASVYESERKRLLASPTALLAEIAPIYETVPRRIAPPAVGVRADGQTVPFEHLSPAEKMKVMTEYRPRVIGRSAAAWIFVTTLFALEKGAPYRLPFEFTAVLADLSLRWKVNFNVNSGQ